MAWHLPAHLHRVAESKFKCLNTEYKLPQMKIIIERACQEGRSGGLVTIWRRDSPWLEWGECRDWGWTQMVDT